MTATVTASWRIRVLGHGREACGAAVLVTREYAVTCAHVVADALAGSAAADPFELAGRVLDLEFVTAGSTTVPALVAPDGWFPESVDHTGDLAVLRLTGPAPDGVKPAPLRPVGAAGQRVAAYGHPPGFDDGLWCEAVTRGSGGPLGSWIQLDPVNTGGTWIGPGYSGAGVVDSGTRDHAAAVGGLVVSAAVHGSTRVAWMMPLDAMATLWPPIATLAPAPAGSAGDPATARYADRRAALARLTQALAGTLTMGRPAGRQRVVDCLRPEIAHRVPRDPATHYDVNSIVEVCRQFEGGLDELLACVRHFEGPSIPMRAVDAAMAQLPEDLRAGR